MQEGRRYIHWKLETVSLKMMAKTFCSAVYILTFCLRCFDPVSWASGRASDV